MYHHTEDSLFQIIDFLLKIDKEFTRVGTIHLGVMKLEGNGQIIPEQLPSISAPEQEGIVKNSAVHAHDAVQFGIRDGGSADDNAAFRQILILTAFCNLGGLLQVIFIERTQIIQKQEITGADFSCSVFDDGVDGNSIVLDQLIAYGEQVEFPNVSSSFSNAVVQEHIEFQLLFAAEPHKICNIHGFEKGNHGIRRFHPEFEGSSSGRILGVDRMRHGTLLVLRCMDF